MNGLEETTFRNGRLMLETTNEPEDFISDGNKSGNDASGGSLMSDGRTMRKISRADLQAIVVPETTETFQPIAHKTLVDSLDEALALRRFRILRSELAASSDGMKLFGLLEINAAVEGVRFAIAGFATRMINQCVSDS